MLAYAATLTPDEEDGGFVVTFRDVPEAITQGDTLDEALHNAADALTVALDGYVGVGRFRSDLQRGPASISSPCPR